MCAWKSKEERDEILKFWTERCGGLVNVDEETFDGRPIILLGDTNHLLLDDRHVTNVVRVDEWTKERLLRHLFFITNGKVVTFQDNELHRHEKSDNFSTPSLESLKLDEPQSVDAPEDLESDRNSSH
jgi:hypothetical protein